MERERQYREVMAWQTTHLLNIAGKSLRREVSLRKIMREIWDTRGEKHQAIDPEAKRAEFWRRIEER